MKSLMERIHSMFSRGLGSIQFVLTIWISLFAIAAMVTVATVMFIKFNNILTANVVTNSAQVVDQVLSTLESYIDNTVGVSGKIVTDMTTYFESDKQTVLNTLEAAYKLRSDIVTLTVLDNEGNVLGSAPSGLRVKKDVDIPSQEWYQDIKNSSAAYAFSSPHVQNIYEGRYNWVVTFSRRIHLYNKDIPSDAVLAIDMNFSSIEENCNRVTIGSRGYVFILDENNNIIYHPQQQMIYSNIKSEDVDFIGEKPDGEYVREEQNNVVVIRSLRNVGWKVVGISYLEDARAAQEDVVSFLTVMFVFAILLVVMIALVMSTRISAPLVRLTGVMDRVEQGDLTVHSSERSFYEAERLSRSFNHMIDRINALLERIKSEEQELRKSELRALQAQINPHFLYNTLGSILWMCERGEGKGAVTMVQALANLFRISISKGNEIITVQDELQHAESYLIIQKVRYKDQFEYSIEADESVMNCRCLKIILQPLIENAIYHGIDRMVDTGRITVRVRGTEEEIFMQVEDNGLGMPQEVLDKILESESSNSYGIGVKNVHNRIQIYFGKEYGLSFRSELDEGTTVSVRLPKLEGNGNGGS